jgi:hypothetical protein
MEGAVVPHVLNRLRLDAAGPKALDDPLVGLGLEEGGDPVGRFRADALDGL